MAWLLLAGPVAVLLLFALSYDHRRKGSGSDYQGISPEEYGTRLYGSSATGKEVKFRRPAGS